jgi:hypothetical protein
MSAAPVALVALFAPYCQGNERAQSLERALALLQRGALQGVRQLKPEGQRPFELRWRAGVAPMEPAALQLEVRGGTSAEPVPYNAERPTFQLVLWLMDWLDASAGGTAPADLPDSFWQWLILGLEPPAPQN